MVPWEFARRRDDELICHSKKVELIRLTIWDQSRNKGYLVHRNPSSSIDSRPKMWQRKSSQSSFVDFEQIWVQVMLMIDFHRVRNQKRAFQNALMKVFVWTLPTLCHLVRIKSFQPEVKMQIWHFKWPFCKKIVLKSPLHKFWYKGYAK